MRAQHISWGWVFTLHSETLCFHSMTSAVHSLHPCPFPVALPYHILTSIGKSWRNHQEYDGSRFVTYPCHNTTKDFLYPQNLVYTQPSIKKHVINLQNIVFEKWMLTYITFKTQPLISQILPPILHLYKHPLRTYQECENQLFSGKDKLDFSFTYHPWSFPPMLTLLALLPKIWLLSPCTFLSIP